IRARVSGSPASGSCTPATLCPPHAMPHGPIAVSNRAKPLAVMRQFYIRRSRATWRILLWSAARRSPEYALEFGKLGRGSVGNGPKAEIALVPVAQAIAATGQGLGEIAA